MFLLCLFVCLFVCLFCLTLKTDVLQYIESMKYSTEPSTPTWMSFTFLLANHLLNQFLFCILMVIIKPTKKQKGMLIVIIPVSTASKGGVYCITSQNGLNSTLRMVVVHD